jgi:hypothetical protein
MYNIYFVLTKRQAVSQWNIPNFLKFATSRLLSELREFMKFSWNLEMWRVLYRYDISKQYYVWGHNLNVLRTYTEQSRYQYTVTPALFRHITMMTMILITLLIITKWHNTNKSERKVLMLISALTNKLNTVGI